MSDALTYDSSEWGSPPPKSKPKSKDRKYTHKQRAVKRQSEYECINTGEGESD